MKEPSLVKGDDGTFPAEWKSGAMDSVLDSATYGLSLRGESSGRYPILRMNCLVDGKVVFRNLQYVDTDDATFSKFRLLKGDILFNRTNSYELVGRTGLFNSSEQAVFASYLIRLRLNMATLSPCFCNYFLNSDSAQTSLRALATRGVSQSNISASKLRLFVVPLPPLPEQKKIAAVLSKLQKAIDVQVRLIEATRDLKKATMNRLFTHGLRGEKQQETPHGSIPRSWRIVPLDKCAYVQAGVTKGRSIPVEEAVELPYLRVANVQDGHLDLSEIKTITIRRDEIGRFLLQHEDVVLTEGGDFDKLGRGFIWESQVESCIHQNHIFAVRAIRDVLLPRFLAYLTQSQYGKDYFLSVAHKTTNLACINSTKLKGLPVPLPTLDEQTEIVATVQSIDRKLENHESHKAALQSLFKTTLNKLMTGQVRVNDLAIDTSEME